MSVRITATGTKRLASDSGAAIMQTEQITALDREEILHLK